METQEVTVVYTKDDFYVGTAPFEQVYEHIANRFEHSRAIERMTEIARSVGVKNFKSLYKDYLILIKEASGSLSEGNVTNFDGQPMEYMTGKWEADDYGIRGQGMYGPVEACPHPILPVQRLVNVDTGTEKVKLAYKRGYDWKDLVIDKSVVANASKIVGLSDYGIAVTSETAKPLVSFLHCVESLNTDRIPVTKSIGRLGWIEGYGFSPYGDNLTFDGDLKFKHLFECVQPKGDYDKWIEIARYIRAEESVVARIVLAASFSSVLIKHCSGLPFFLHLYGGTETGKTVATMAAASIWGNPPVGEYIQTFDSTAVGREMYAGFLNSLPLMFDELQIAKMNRKEFDTMIYKLAEGSGRLRGSKEGGVQKIITWSNCIITTGEDPMISSSSGGGASNRTIEISCEDVKVINDHQRVLKAIKGNYGLAGREFIKQLSVPENLEMAKEIQAEYLKALTECFSQTTEKQLLSASLILTADVLSNIWIFKDDKVIHEQDLLKFLTTKAEVSQHERGYEFILDWITQNGNRFSEDGTGEIYGKIQWGIAYIIPSVLEKALADNNYNYRSMIAWLKKNNKIDCDYNRLTKKTRIQKYPQNCIALFLPKEEHEGFLDVSDENNVSF